VPTARSSRASPPEKLSVADDRLLDRSERKENYGTVVTRVT